MIGHRGALIELARKEFGSYCPVPNGELPRQELRRRTNFRSVRRASMSASDVLAIAGAAAQGFGFAAVLYEASRIRRNELGYVGRLQRAWGVITDTLPSEIRPPRRIGSCRDKSGSKPESAFEAL